MDTITVIVISAVVGFFFWILEVKIKKREDKEEQRDKDRQEFEILIIESINANTDLAIANNIALKNGKCNGESERAMERVIASIQKLIWEFSFHLNF